MGEEAYDEIIIVADRGTLFIRGGYGRGELYLGLCKGRGEEPDILVELTGRQIETLKEAIDDMMRWHEPHEEEG